MMRATPAIGIFCLTMNGLQRTSSSSSPYAVEGVGAVAYAAVDLVVGGLSALTPASVAEAESNLLARLSEVATYEA
jgi:hypothetical protein